MTGQLPGVSRRCFLGGLTAAAALHVARSVASNDRAPIPLALTVKETAAGSAGKTWVFDPAMSQRILRFRQGDRLRASFTNALPVPVLLNGYGFDGLPALEPLLVQPPLPPGQSFDFDLVLADAGTFALDARLLGEGLPQPLPMTALVVSESEAPGVDQDHVLLIEDSRLREDGTAPAAPADAAQARAVYTVNGLPNFDIAVQAHERLRLRLINGCQRNAIALQFPGHDVRAIAFDSRAAEPFPARDGRLVLAPGTRIDVMLDATGQPGSTAPILLFDGTGPKQVGRLAYGSAAPVRPQLLPPVEAVRPPQTTISLQGALRVAVELGSAAARNEAGWLAPGDMVADRRAPAFRAKRGRTVVLALKNPAARPVVFRLHGHHFRWLDRLDDGWKPFLLDTLLLDAGQTERIAFVAQHSGPWLMESAAAEWSSPKLLRWFAVD